MDRQTVITEAIHRLENSSATIPANLPQDRASLADTLREDSQAGGTRGFAAYKTAQRINAA